MSFRVHLLDWLHPHTLYTIRMDVELTQHPDVVERESYVWVDAVVEAGRKDSAIRARRARLVVDLGNQPPSFTLVTETLVVLEDGVVAARLAKDVSPGPPGVNLESESSQHTTFSIKVVEAGEGWRPVFRPQQQPRISATGELTFGLALAPGTPPLPEFQSHTFQLEVALHDDGGVEHGGLDTSDPLLVDVVVIGSPQAPPSVSAQAHQPRAVRVSWTSTEEAVQAHLMAAGGRIHVHLVQLRRKLADGRFETLHEAIEPFPSSTTLFEGLTPGTEYYPFAAACNVLVCSSALQGAWTTALQVPSRPRNIRLTRRTASQAVVSWDPPTNPGDGAPFDPATAHRFALAFRFQLCQICDGASIYDSKPSEWADHVVLAAGEHGALFTSPPLTLQFLSLAFANAVGDSETTTTSFVVEEMDCEVRCGDGLRVSSESCDDGNLEDGDGCSSQCTIEKNYLCHDLAPPGFSCRPAIYGASQCRQPAFTSVRVEPSTSLPGASNLLYVSFAANFEMLRSEDIELRGLRGSGTPDSFIDAASSFVYLAAGGPDENQGHADVVHNPTVWLVWPGTVRFRLTRNVPAFSLVVFALALTNGLESQPHQNVLLICEDCCAGSTALKVQPGNLSRSHHSRIAPHLRRTRAAVTAAHAWPGALHATLQALTRASWHSGAGTRGDGGAE
jgi:cysteine-rich repeat protein